MHSRRLILTICILSLSLSVFAQKKSAMSSGAAPDKAYLQKMLDGWSSLDSSSMAQYYDQGSYNFFDIAPLKYSNWAEYQKGSQDLLKGYKSVKLTMNDDAQLHHEGNLMWATATVKEDATTATGKKELATMRWTVIMEKKGPKWLVVHEHLSEPLQ